MKTKIYFRKNLLILLTILFFGLCFRIVSINNNPPSLYGDELTIALDAYSLSKTGHDQLGNFLPLTFAMGAGRPAGYVYGSIPFVALFGPTALGVRALSILSGMGILVLLYLTGKKIFSEKLGLLAAAIGAVSPWEISLSRGGFEAHFALFLALLGTYLFIVARQKPILYIFSAFSFGLVLHTYPTYKLSLLLFLPLLLWYQSEKKVFAISKKYFISGVIILAILGIISLSQTFIGGSEARFSNINIFSQGKIKVLIEQKINFERHVTNLPYLISKFFHNKPVEYIKVFIENYLQNFSLDFLILHGDRNPRHNMVTMGEIYFAEIILLLIGFSNFWQRQKKIIIFLLFWILLSPIPTAIIDLPHALRSSFMLPPLIILSALGLVTIIEYKKKLLLYLILTLFVIQFAFFVQKLYFLSPNEYSNFWSYPAKIASQFAIENKNKYNYIILSDKIIDIEFAYCAYAKLNPELIISQNKKRSLLVNSAFKKFDNIYIGFIPDEDTQNFIKKLDGSVLYIGLPEALKYLNDSEIINSKNDLQMLIINRTFK
ncbi:MAG: glycosyltransferase family 39 protein [Actinobacteria bacterium]|nr:glycosyltransferase family 39 protein [Actinomycetota bacterium]